LAKLAHPVEDQGSMLLQNTGAELSDYMIETQYKASAGGVNMASSITFMLTYLHLSKPPTQLLPKLEVLVV
jgi:hypothetical protein